MINIALIIVFITFLMKPSGDTNDRERETEDEREIERQEDECGDLMRLAAGSDHNRCEPRLHTFRYFPPSIIVVGDAR